MSLAQLLQTLEERLLDPATRRDAEALTGLLAEDFREFGSSGRIYSRAAIIAELASEDYTPPEIVDFETRLLAPNLALATYRSVRPERSALRSSLWVCREGRWQMLFHQGTRVPE